MEVTSFSPIQSSQNIQGLHRIPAGQNAGLNKGEPARQTAALMDSVSFSEESLRLSDVAQADTKSSKIRFDLVNRVKAEIAAGTYDTPDKMDVALDRMVSRILG